MPFYVYRCKKCNIEAEYNLKVSHDIPLCPKCGEKMEIVIQPVGIIFKGLDFPSNDLKRYKSWKRGEIHEEK